MHGHHTKLRRFRAASLILVLAMCLTAIAGPMSAAAQSAPQVVSPQVIHTGTGPTGYEVTFRYYDPTATSVRIKGEWFFSDDAHSATAPYGGTTGTSAG